MKNISVLFKWAGVCIIIALLLLPNNNQNVQATGEPSLSFQSSSPRSPQEAILTEDDLPGFREAEESEVVGYLALAKRITFGLSSPQTEIADISCFRINNLFRSEYVISFLAYPISENEESAFDALANNPQSILEILNETTQTSGNAEEPRLHSELDDIGEKSMGFSMTLGQEPVAQNIDFIWVRRGEIIQSTWVIYPIGETPSISLHQLGQVIDQRVAERFIGTTFRPAGSLVPEITTHIPTPLDISTRPSVIGTNLLLAAFMMLPLAVAAEIFTHLLADREEMLRDRFRLPGWILKLKRWFESFLGVHRKQRTANTNILRLCIIMLFYGLIFSLLDRTWNPLSVTGLVLFLNMTVAYGIVGLADDIVQWRVLRKWGKPAELTLRPTNILIAAASTITSRLLRLVPGFMFGTPEALNIDESQLDIQKRNSLLKISAYTLLTIGLGLWGLTTITAIVQQQNISDTLGNVIGWLEGFLLVIFAVALENTFIKMLGLPGSFGEALRKRNRWLWLLGLVFVTFTFYHTLINPRGELAEALQNSNVWIFLGVSGAFVILTIGLWAYVRIKARKPAAVHQSDKKKSKKVTTKRLIPAWAWLILIIGATALGVFPLIQQNNLPFQAGISSPTSASESIIPISPTSVTDVSNETLIEFMIPIAIEKLCFLPLVNVSENIPDSFTWRSVQLIAAQYGAQAKYIVPETPDDSGYTKAINQLIQDNCDLIVGSWFDKGQGQVFQTAALGSPEQDFMVFGGVPDLPNLWATEYSLHEGAYLAGYAAAAISKSGKVGTFGGDQNRVVNSSMNCFAQGVNYYNEVHQTDVAVYGWDVDTQQGMFASSFCSPDKGIALTDYLLAQGADTIFPLAHMDSGSTGYGTGVIAQQQEGVYVIGVDLDWVWAMPEFADVIFTSVETRYDQSIAIAVDALANGEFYGGEHKGTLASGEIQLSPLRDLSYLLLPDISDELAHIAYSSSISACQALQSLESNPVQPVLTLTPQKTPTATPSPTITPKPTATPDMRVYNPENGHWYLVTPQMGWLTAKNYCSSRGGHLLIIESASEDMFVFNFAPYALLGATDKYNEGDWVWGATRDSLSYTNWADGQPGTCDLPNCEPENYLAYAFHDRFEWHDVDYNFAPYICEWEE